MQGRLKEQRQLSGEKLKDREQQAADLQLALALPPMQNIRTKVFQLTAESAADKHQLRCQHQLRY